MQTQMMTINRTNYHTYLFVGMCWLFPIAIVSLTIGPIQWLNHWASQNHWNANYRTIGLVAIAIILVIAILFLTKYTTRFLFQPQETTTPIHKGIWIFLTLSCIASLSWLIVNPDLFNAISQSFTYFPLH
jgi:hypothetical protein